MNCPGEGMVHPSGSWWMADALLNWADRRRARISPIGKLWPSRRGLYPALLGHVWYRLHTPSKPDPLYVWLETAHGMTRVQRADVELRGMSPATIGGPGALPGPRSNELEAAGSRLEPCTSGAVRAVQCTPAP